MVSFFYPLYLAFLQKKHSNYTIKNDMWTFHFPHYYMESMHIFIGLKEKQVNTKLKDSGLEMCSKSNTN